jgi:hypothetical protein
METGVNYNKQRLHKLEDFDADLLICSGHQSMTLRTETVRAASSNAIISVRLAL